MPESEQFSDITVRPSSPRIDVTKLLRSMPGGPNHLMLAGTDIGMRSLVEKCLGEKDLPAMVIDVSAADSVSEFAAMIRDELRRLCPDVPIGLCENERYALTGILQLADRLFTAERRLVIVFHEFHHVRRLAPWTEYLMRSVMQFFNNVTFIFTGSNSKVMTDIFCNVRKPFFHFGLFVLLEPGRWS